MLINGFGAMDHLLVTFKVLSERRSPPRFLFWLASLQKPAQLNTPLKSALACAVVNLPLPFGTSL
jgi:hypothetical protein